MGDTPTNPADRLGANAPKELRAFLACDTDAVTMKDGKLTWTGAPVAPSLSIEPDEDDQSKGTLKVGIGPVGLTLPASVDANGQLTVDTSNIPLWTDELKGAKDAIDGFVANANAWFAEHKKQLGPPIFIKGQVRLAKVPLVAQPQTATSTAVATPGTASKAGSSTSGPSKGAASGWDAPTAADAGIAIGSTVLMPPTLPPASVVAPQGSQPNPPFNPPPTESSGKQVQEQFERQRAESGRNRGGPAVRGSSKAMAPDVLRELATKAFVLSVLAVAIVGLAGGALVGRAGLLAAATPSHRPGGVLESPTPGPDLSAEASPEASGEAPSGGASAVPSTGATNPPTSAPTPQPSTQLALSKIAWTMYLQAGSDQIDSHCRIMVRADVELQALGSSGEEDQALLDYVIGKSATVRMSGPGLPQEIQVPLTQQGSNYADFGDITVATAGASYQETLVDAAGIPLNLKSQVFVNPCTH